MNPIQEALAASDPIATPKRGRPKRNDRERILGYLRKAEYCRRVETFRRKAGLSIRQLNEKTGVGNERTVAQYEQKCFIPEGFTHEFAAAFGISVEMLARMRVEFESPQLYSAIFHTAAWTPSENEIAQYAIEAGKVVERKTPERDTEEELS